MQTINILRVISFLVQFCILVISQPISEWYPGVATHFQGPQDLGDNQYDPQIPAGSCGYGELDPKLYPFWGVAQLSSFSPMVEGEIIQGCGACFEVQCVDEERCKQNNSTTVMITDSCKSGCVQQQLNMHVFAFQHLAPSSWGEIPIRFRRVSCQPPSGMVVRVTDYRETYGGWIRLVIMEVAGKANIKSVGLRQHAQTQTQNSNNSLRSFGRPAYNAWMQMNNSYGAAWELSGIPEPPFDIRVEMEDGQTAVLGKVIEEVRVGGTYESHTQIHDNEVSEVLQTAETSNGFIGDVAMFPVFSMPPLDGSMNDVMRNASPYPISAIQPQRSPPPAQQRPQEVMPPVSLDQLLNPTITLSSANSSLPLEAKKSGVDENSIPKLTYQLQNSTDWTYIARAFERLGWLAPSQKSKQNI
eukprot:TRINITY_DN3259_c0_g1_i3.p1 TRINITY_DN3259_c0_g1~~TRINITY_DN3259_c0_g1_i3.p1  ORF type:complete len:465 (-),score=51.32 TRINITY_DN3259_c0_g1_i3:454-1695(-)